MNDMFRFDGPLFKIGTLIGDLLILSLLFIVCSIPIITIGASVTALYYVTTRMISGREGYVSRDFMRSFKQNFIKSTVVFVLIAICAFILLCNFTLFNYVYRANQFMLVFQVVLSAELAGISVYIFPLIARFDMKIGQYFKNAFFFANRHISTTVTCLVFLAGAAMLFMRLPILIIIITGAYSYFSSKLLMRVFRKYLPDMDRDIDDYHIRDEAPSDENEVK